jgi:hypothetical protein
MVRTRRESKRLTRIVDELLDPACNELGVEQLLRERFTRERKSVRVFGIRHIDRRNRPLEPSNVIEFRHVEKLSTRRDDVHRALGVLVEAHALMSAPM